MMYVLAMVPLTKAQRAAQIAAARERIEKSRRDRQARADAKAAKAKKRGKQ